MLASYIRRLREERGISQEQLAKEIGVSRPTYVLIEKGERELTISEAQKLARIFGIRIEDFMDAKKSDVKVELPEEDGPTTKKEEKQEMRISVPQKNMKKFKEVLLYLLQKVGAKPNVGETVLYKLLYFIDFDYYEKFEEQLMGLQYKKNHHGPTPLGFAEIVERMEKHEELMCVKSKYFQYDQKKYMPLREPDLTTLSAREMKHIDEVIARLGEKNATEIREYSHEDIPWIIAEEGKPLEYEAVFYRSPKTSVRNYDDDSL